MKQKVVIEVTCNGSKSRTKALKIAVRVSGVEEAWFKGEDKGRIEVTGAGMDAVKLATLLRKNLGHVELISVSAVGGVSQQPLSHGRNRWRIDQTESRGKDFGEEGLWRCSFDACDGSLCCFGIEDEFGCTVC